MFPNLLILLLYVYVYFFLKGICLSPTYSLFPIFWILLINFDFLASVSWEKNQAVIFWKSSENNNF